MKKTGGPAFPGDQERERPEGGHYIKHDIGMTLRDYFAAKAMHEILVGGGWSEYDNLAKEAYGVADAMITERTKEE